MSRRVGSCALSTLYPGLFVCVDSKLDSKNHLHLLPELADLNNCNNALYFEARRHEDLYLWAAKTPNGPSIKMHVQNVHTMDELKMTGNCLKGSRGLLSFDKAFDETEWGRLRKEMFTHVSLIIWRIIGPLMGFVSGFSFVPLFHELDLWCTINGSEGKAVHSSYPDLLDSGLKDMVP